MVPAASRERQKHDGKDAEGNTDEAADAGETGRRGVQSEESGRSERFMAHAT